ncbi:hypothetical protein VTI74DRAFT_7939 [Chaetomium olivicolor]
MPRTGLRRGSTSRPGVSCISLPRTSVHSLTAPQLEDRISVLAAVENMMAKTRSMGLVNPGQIPPRRRSEGSGSRPVLPRSARRGRRGRGGQQVVHWVVTAVLKVDWAHFMNINAHLYKIFLTIPYPIVATLRSPEMMFANNPTQTGHQFNP